ncbi:MAG: hypothetical protein VB089_20240, partial [Anaerolineaceae bacterium]|nr:hypothetical protein [Anaerolineaceae bacterium]
MAQPTFLVTKLIPQPNKKTWVDRARLFTRLDGLLAEGVRLALVSAPAGFGKTTLVSAWVHRPGAPAYAWLSLDEQDNDPLTFWSYLVAALRQDALVDGGPRRPALPVFQSATPLAFLDQLINQLSQASSCRVLVLDDFHLVRSTAITQGIAYLVDHLPAQLRLVLLTRSDPALPLATLRARGQLVDVRLDDLRFSAAEAGDFLNGSAGLQLSPAAVATLHHKTEGWVAGLQMAAVSLRKCSDAEAFIDSFSGSNRYVLDYLAGEVLKRQPPEVQAFLLQTSILDSLCAPLCATLLAGESGGDLPAAQRTLEYLEDNNLFIVALDEERSWYRYHALFLDLLRKRLGQAYPGQSRRLHARASHWYAANGDFYAAVEHAFSGRDFERAAGLIDEAADELLGNGQHSLLLKSIRRLPEEQLSDHPRLPLFEVAVLTTHGDIQEAEQRLQALEQRLPELAPGDPLAGWLASRSASIRALIAVCQGDIHRAQAYIQQVFEHISPDDQSPWRPALFITLSNLNLSTGDPVSATRNMFEAIRAGKQAWQAFMVLDAMTQLTMVLWARGQMNDAAELCQEGLALVREKRLENDPVAGMLYLGWGFLLCERGELDEAESYIRRGMDLCSPTSKLWSLLWAHQVWMRLLIARHDLEACEAAARQAERLSQENQVPVWLTSVNSGLRARV